MKVEQILTDGFCNALEELYHIKPAKESISIQKTRKEFTGDYTFNVFPFLKASKKNPEITANELGNHMKDHLESVTSFEVIKGFLNIKLHQSVWLQELEYACSPNFKLNKTDTPKKIVIEFSSPNTNKPLHLGHIRNNLLGDSLSRILSAVGHSITRVNLVNDRGIHICKSMLAWKYWGNEITPEKANKKGDKLVGDFYVLFDKKYREEIEKICQTGITKEEAEKESKLMKDARNMLVLWESDDTETRQLWAKMNQWVYKGFDVTYDKLGIQFDKTYYESNTYNLGKTEVHKALENKLLFKKEDQSVWIDLSNEGFDEKLLLRGDGTSVYITQDIGTAILRQNDYKADEMIYVVGNEQNYHFQILKLILEKMGYSWAQGISHFSYGMVELPEGKMKSREGTIVDADDLVDEMIRQAREASIASGKLSNIDSTEAENIYKTVALGALKYFILKVDPKKNMMFNPKESIDFEGNTGPFIQYTFARINSILRKSETLEQSKNTSSGQLIVTETELNIIKRIYDFETTIHEASQTLSPSVVANYAFALAKEFNQFYHESPILKEENHSIREFRLQVCVATSKIIKLTMNLLGISVPDQM